MAENKGIDHIAVIMDGNGRWAKKRSRPRVWGHIRGSSIISNIVEEANDLGVKALTLYAFSSENWSRPLKEVTTLFSLLRKFLLKEKNRIIKNNIRFKVMGEIGRLPEATLSLIQGLEAETADNQGLKLTFAFGYGGRNELLSAVNQFIEQNPGKKLEESDIRDNLYVPDLPDVDLLIRTGGDYRISNFLLWQIAYAELYFTPTMWPDFTCHEFRSILSEVSNRERRFGAIEKQPSLDITKKLAYQNKKKINNPKGFLNV